MGERSCDLSDDDFGEVRDGEEEEVYDGRSSRLGSSLNEESQSDNGYGQDSSEVHESQENEELSEYEQLRRRNIIRNHGCLQALGLIKDPKPKVFVHNVSKL
jgi:hypothetical protein